MQLDFSYEYYFYFKKCNSFCLRLNASNFNKLCRENILQLIRSYEVGLSQRTLDLYNSFDKNYQYLPY